MRHKSLPLIAAALGLTSIQVAAGPQGTQRPGSANTVVDQPPRGGVPLRQIQARSDWREIVQEAYYRQRRPSDRRPRQQSERPAQRGTRSSDSKPSAAEPSRRGGSRSSESAATEESAQTDLTDPKPELVGQGSAPETDGQQTDQSELADQGSDSETDGQQMDQSEVADQGSDSETEVRQTDQTEVADQGSGLGTDDAWQPDQLASSDTPAASDSGRASDSADSDRDVHRYASVQPTEGLRLRAGPGTEKAVRQVLPTGLAVTITDSDAPGPWVAVTTPLGDGYVHDDYLTDPKSRPLAQHVAEVQASGLNFRKGPGTHAGVHRVLPKGTEVVLLDRLNDANWVLVRQEDQVGFLHTDYLSDFEPHQPEMADPAPRRDATDTDQTNKGEKVAKANGADSDRYDMGVERTVPGTVTASGLNLRPEPTTDATAEAVLPHGTEVAAVSQIRVGDRAWLTVDTEKGRGYVAADYVALKETPAPSNRDRSAFVAEATPLRDYPATGSATVRHLDTHQTLSLIARAPMPDGLWWKVKAGDAAGFLPGDTIRQGKPTGSGATQIAMAAGDGKSSPDTEPANGDGDSDGKQSTRKGEEPAKECGETVRCIEPGPLRPQIAAWFEDQPMRIQWKGPAGQWPERIGTEYFPKDLDLPKTVRRVVHKARGEHGLPLTGTYFKGNDTIFLQYKGAN